MTRFFIAGVLALTACSPAFAQDMPLSQILIDGEGWKKVEGKPERPKEAIPAYVIGTQIKDPRTSWRTPLAAVRSASGDTIYVSYNGSSDLWAYVADAKGATGKGARYCELRTPRGRLLQAVSLTADRDGRIYALTDLGVQVFDPTGRLCGVLTPAAPGLSNHLAFEGDKLTLWIGDTKYARKLNTRGAK